MEAHMRRAPQRKYCGFDVVTYGQTFFPNCARDKINVQAHAQAKAQQAAAEAHHLDATAQQLQVKAQAVAVGTASSLDRVRQSAELTSLVFLDASET